MRRISKTLISNLTASLENEEVRDPVEVTPTETPPADAVVQTPEVTTPPVEETPPVETPASDVVPATTETPPEVQTAAEVVVTTASAEVPVAAEAPVVTPEGEQVAPATEGVKGALIGAAAGTFGPLGGAIGGHYAEKHIDELKAKIEKLEEENKNLRTGKSIAKEDGEVTTDEVTQVPADVPATDASPEVGAEVPAETTATAEPAVTTPPAEVAAQAAAAALAEAGVPAETRVVVTVVEPALSEDEQNELADQGEEIEADLDEASRAATEAEEVCGEVQTLLDTGSEVAQYGEIAKDASENGGLSDDGARILTVAVEAAYERVGLGGYSYIPALESFSGKHTRVGATTVAMEDIGSKIKGIAKTIAEGAKKFLEFMSNFVKSIFTATGRMESRAKKIQEAAKSFKGNGSSELNSPALAKKLAVGTSVPTNISQGMKLINQFVVEATSNLHAEKTSKLLNGIESYYKATNSAQKDAASESVTKMYDEIEKDFDAVLEILNINLLKATNTANSDKYNVPEAPEGTDLVSSPVFPGNRVIWAHKPRSLEDIHNLRIGVGSFDGDVVPKLANLSGSDISAIAHEALQFLSIKSTFEQTMKKYSSGLAGLGVALGSFAMLSGGDASQKSESFFENMKTVFQLMKKAYNATTVIVNGLNVRSVAEAMRIHNAALDYAQLALASGTKSNEAPKQLAAA